MRFGPLWKKSIILIALAAIPAALLGFFLLLRVEFAQIRELRETVDRSVETRADLASLLSLHQAIEAGQRGYVLTQNRSFLEPYLRALQRIEPTFADLEKGAAIAPELEEGAQHLRSLSRQKLAFAGEVVALVQAGNEREARSRIATGRGKALMDDIQREVARLDAIQSSRLGSVSRRGEDSRISIERIINAVLLAFALLLTLIGAFLWRAIRERQAALTAVQTLSDRQHAIFEGTVDAMLVLDAEGYIRDLNPSVIRQFQYDRAELIGRHNTALMAFPPSLEASQAWLRSVGVAGREGAGSRNEFTGQRKDGVVFETDVAVSRFSDAGSPAYIAVIRDITDRKRVEQMKTEFVSTVSHELRTPLTSIGGSLGLLASGAVGSLNDKAARLVTIAHSNCERLIRLINDILDIEKIESGNMTFVMQPIAVDALVASTLASNAAFAGQHGVTLEHQGAPGLSVMGDADRLEQLLTNLVSNAIKHAPRGTAVEVAAAAAGTRVRIEVRDRGAGIPLDFREQIFGKFAMADSSDSRAKGGTGLGLSIAREIAERHGGQIGYFDRAGGGTTFYVDLPLVESGALPGAEVSATGPVILHIDDDPDCLNVVASAFGERARVWSATSIDAAREAIATASFAAAIIDIGLTSDDGRSLIPAFRRNTPDLPIVLFTAHDDPHAASGADALLVKSKSSVEKLVETTLHLIANKASQAR